ncbi:uncharacterized protein LOC129731128 [Wyeomyia smithii]|uniref:uncharacterized protein LOC129731128 n=1 Tax=Wyeomyia smithii TaxID=174621 RepID=UPI002467C7C5|nr:uncharacterized protein LOC129731128 [Wyeomyia smithii]
MGHSITADNMTLVPKWLHNDFLLNVIRKAQNDSSLWLCHGCKLRAETVPSRSQKPSIVLRTTVHYRSKRFHNEQAINLIMKIIPSENGLTNEYSVLGTEVAIYSQVLPAMIKTMKDVGENVDFPRLIYASPKPNTIVILENVNPMNWRSFEEYRSTFDDVIATTHAIAKFHALSFFLCQTSIDLTQFKSICAEPDANLIEKFNAFANTTSTWEAAENITRKIQNINPSAIAHNMKQVYKANTMSSGYNVLNHGAIHPKNLFYKVDNTGLVTKTMLIDFQHCHWGSPAIDLICLLDLVVKPEVKASKRNEIIHEYYNHFAQVLSKIGYLGSVPTLTDLHVELLRKGFLEVLHNVHHLETSDKSNEQLHKAVHADMVLLLHRGIV